MDHQYSCVETLHHKIREKMKHAEADVILIETYLAEKKVYDFFLLLGGLLAGFFSGCSLSEL